MQITMHNRPFRSPRTCSHCYMRDVICMEWQQGLAWHQLELIEVDLAVAKDATQAKPIKRVQSNPDRITGIVLINASGEFDRR